MIKITIEITLEIKKIKLNIKGIKSLNNIDKLIFYIVNPLYRSRKNI